MALPPFTPRLGDHAEALLATLRTLGTPARAVAEKRYLKSELTHLGVPVPLVRKTVLSSVKGQGAMDPARLWDLVADLWRPAIHESRLSAVLLLEAYGDLLVPNDMDQLEPMIRQARTWGLLDTLAVHGLGKLVANFPGPLGKVLDRFARDPDFWVRRCALLALLLPLRQGGGDFARFGRYADAMLEEKEFFIRKAIGWVLRETAKQNPAIVIAWLLPRKTRASGLTLREACKHLPTEEKRKILGK